MGALDIKLTVITPCFNAKKFITTCIDNIIDQHCTNIEHLIIDGGSSDGTIEIIKNYANKHPHICFISEPDKGQSDAMNKGINLAQGEYISFLNADDTYTDGTLQFFLAYLENSNPNFLCGNLNVFNENYELLYISKPSRNKLQDIYFSHTYPINPSSYFYKKAIHNKIGLYKIDDHLTMDLDFFLRYINAYKCYTYIDQVFGNFYVSKETKTFQDRESGNMFRRKEELFKKYWKKNPFHSRALSILKNKLK